MWPEQDEPDYTLDLHGLDTIDAKIALDELFRDIAEAGGGPVRVLIIVGRGLNSPNGPVMPTFVQSYLAGRGLSWESARSAQGGDGAMVVRVR